MNRSEVTNVGDILAGQLQLIEAGKYDWLRFLMMKDNAYGSRAEQMIAVYCMFLEKMIQESDFDALNEIVLIGSSVELRLIGRRTNTMKKFTIAFPDQVQDDKISFLSPMGLQSLLASKGDLLTIDMSDRIIRAEVMDVQWV